MNWDCLFHLSSVTTYWKYVLEMSERFLLTPNNEKETEFLQTSNPWTKHILKAVHSHLFVFETGSHYIAQAGLELTSSCLYLPSPVIKSMHHYS